MFADSAMRGMAHDIQQVPGVVGVVLGGSRARGDARPDSDVDLGIYYVGLPDTTALTQVAMAWSAQDVRVGEPGSWGPWVDAGGWLKVDNTAVDWILRDLDRVRQQWAAASRGQFAFHAQAGHPLGFWDAAYVGELALGVVLTDPTGALAHLREVVRVYPAALRDAMIGALWEARFLVDISRKGAGRADSAYVAQCLTRALMLCAHALNAADGRWVTNEKGLVPGVATLTTAPEGFADRAAGALAGLGRTSVDLLVAVDLVNSLVAETSALLDESAPRA